MTDRLERPNRKWIISLYLYSFVHLVITSTPEVVPIHKFDVTSVIGNYLTSKCGVKQSHQYFTCYNQCCWVAISCPLVTGSYLFGYCIFLYNVRRPEWFPSPPPSMSCLFSLFVCFQAGRSSFLPLPVKRARHTWSCCKPPVILSQVSARAAQPAPVWSCLSPAPSGSVLDLDISKTCFNQSCVSAFGVLICVRSS